MANFKKVLLVSASFVLVAALSIGGTLAYLTDNDSDVNVMTLGEVDIEQHEYERVVENGEYKKDTIDGQTSYVLKDFTQAKPLYPIVGDPSLPETDPEYAGWDTVPVRMSQVDSYGGMQVFAGKNAVDKFVTVENTGKTDAYVRTLVAIEIGTADAGLIGTSYHGTWSKNIIGVITVDDNNYLLIEHVYNGASGVRHENGVLPAGDTSYPSLCQVYIKSKATNEDMVKLDGNGNGTLDILVLSQAVQTAGFASAEKALDTAFGETNAVNAATWFSGNVTYASNLNDVEEAFAEGGTVILADDIALDDILYVENGADVRLNMNGKTFTASGKMDPEGGFIWVKDGSSLTIEGNGTFDLGANPGLSFIVPQGEVVIENGTFIRNVPAGTDPSDVGAMFVGTKTGSLVINGGYFDGGYYDKNANGIEEILAGTATLTETANDKAKRGQSGDANIVRVALKNNISKNLNMTARNVKVYGGTFVGVNPAWGDEGCMLPTTPNYLRPWSYYQGAFLDGQTFNENGIVLPDGYTITKGATADGRPTYTVKYSK